MAASRIALVSVEGDLKTQELLCVFFLIYILFFQISRGSVGVGGCCLSCDTHCAYQCWRHQFTAGTAEAKRHNCRRVCLFRKTRSQRFVFVHCNTKCLGLLKGFAAAHALRSQIVLLKTAHAMLRGTSKGRIISSNLCEQLNSKI